MGSTLMSGPCFVHLMGYGDGLAAVGSRRHCVRAIIDILTALTPDAQMHVTASPSHDIHETGAFDRDRSSLRHITKIDIYQ